MPQAERKFYQKTWFGYLLVIVAVCLGLIANRLGFEFVGRVTGILAPLLIVFMLLVLAYPRLCPRVHRNLRMAFRLDDPEQKRKAGLPDDN